MALPLHRRITSWIFNNLIWDPAGTAREGFLKGLWATRKLILAIVGSALLDWLEWREHHPPDMVLVALVHFVFALALVAFVVYIWQGFSQERK
jgi:hypothetical protein